MLNNLTIFYIIENMESQISFRDIQIHDYQESKALLSRLIKENEDFSIESFSKVCSSLNSDHRIVCCFYNDIEAETKVMVAMGTIMVENKLIHNCSHVGHIEDIIVHENYRSLNFGKTLINYLVDIARERQVYKVILNCNEFNAPFYQKCGFHKSNVEMRINI